jgi:hypothetical protein
MDVIKTIIKYASGKLIRVKTLEFMAQLYLYDCNNPAYKAEIQFRWGVQLRGETNKCAASR